jgi:hypothetical protein
MVGFNKFLKKQFHKNSTYTYLFILKIMFTIWSA